MTELLLLVLNPTIRITATQGFSAEPNPGCLGFVVRPMSDYCWFPPEVSKASGSEVQPKLERPDKPAAVTRLVKTFMHPVRGGIAVEDRISRSEDTWKEPLEWLV